MAPDVVELGRRAVKCAGWRWVEGMQGHENATPGMSMHRGGMFRVWHEDDAIPHAGTPDLTDPATLGALLGLVREAWADKVVVSVGGGWWEVSTDEVDAGWWDADNTTSFGDALVCALEAATVRS